MATLQGSQTITHLVVLAGLFPPSPSAVILSLEQMARTAAPVVEDQEKTQAIQS
tara:strand:- start:933 stop:1094 length:162 start_codon:yes stop_codon:yes gene_type:complete